MSSRGFGAADVCAKRAGQAIGIVSVEEVVPIPQLRIVAVRREHQRRAARPSPDQARRPARPCGRRPLLRRARTVSSLQELPEAGDILLQLPIDDVRSVDAEVAQPLGRMIRVVERGQQPAGVELRRHDRRRWHDPVVVRVTQDELARGNALAADPGNRRLRDAVVKPERLVVALGAVAALHAAGQLDDTAARLGDERALRVAGGVELGGRDRVNEDDGMERRERRAAKFPLAGSLSSVSPRILDRCSRAMPS